MTTPIYNFLVGYKSRRISRFHMPGHKGVGFLGVERLDITEVDGADVLYSPDGIIAESEKNATDIFDTAHTYYSTEGSTLAIKAMLTIIARKHDTGATVLAARNVHKAFVYAVGALGLDVEWIYPRVSEHICKCDVGRDELLDALNTFDTPPAAVYITTPDYLGNLLDVRGIAEVCNERGIPLLVDNAHGAYLAFLEPSLHPIHLGAAMCCDSAHKTLPVLTGGAYLHVARGFEEYTDEARNALSMFASTSPSYLTLASLDLCNYLIDPNLDDGRETFAEKLKKCTQSVTFIKSLLADRGQADNCAEPLKIRIDARRFLNTGWGVAEILRSFRIEPEFADEDYVILMASPFNSDRDFKRLKRAICAVTKKVAEDSSPKTATAGAADGNEARNLTPVRAMSIRDALLSPSELISTEDALGRICATPTVSCPPAVPIAVSGEIIDEVAISLFKKYKIEYISVVK